MVFNQVNPWGDLSVTSLRVSDKNQEFEDNFLPPFKVHNEAEEESYIALDDSEQYLSRLEAKLTKLTGGNGGSGSNVSSRALLAGLRSSRQCHQHSLLMTDNIIPSENTKDEELSLPRARGILLQDGQTHLNSLVQRLAPDKLALSVEELVQLLAADSLTDGIEQRTDGALDGSEKNADDHITCGEAVQELVNCERSSSDDV